MEWGICKSPEVSDNDEDFDIELELNSKIILQHFKQTGQFIEPELIQNKLSTSPKKHESPTKKYQDSVKFKIIQLEEEDSNLLSKGDYLDNNTQSCELLLQTFAKVNPSNNLLYTQYVYQDTQSNKLSVFSKSTALKTQSSRQNDFEIHNKLKSHQNLKLVDRLQDDLDKMLTVAEQNYQKMKQKAQNIQQNNQKIQQQQKAKKQAFQKQKILKQNNQKQNHKKAVKKYQQKRQQKQNSFSYTKQISKQRKLFKPNESPSKLFKPYNRIQQNSIECKHTIKNNYKQQEYVFPPTPKRSPNKPRTSLAFERKGSYITNSPKKCHIPFQQQRIGNQNANLELLCSGKTFRKKSSVSGYFEDVDVYCSPDYNRLIIRTSNYDSTIIRTNQILQIKIDQSKQTLFKLGYEQRNKYISEQNFSFSILFHNQIVQLYAKSAQQRFQFVKSLQQLLKLTHK